MKLTESIRISWRAIRSHKLRSALTTLGVIIGIAAVITFMVLGSGFSESIVGDIEADQDPIMTVHTQTEPPDGVGIMPVETPIYTESDVEALEDRNGVAFVAPQGTLDVVQTSVDGEQVTGIVTAQATTDDRFEYESFLEGEPFAGENETVISEQTSQLFEENVSVGDELQLMFEDGDATNVTIAGIVEDQSGPQTSPQIYLPVDPYYTTTVETPQGEDERAYPVLQVGAEGIETVDTAQDAVESYLETDSDAAALKQDDHQIQVQTLEDAIDQFTDIVDQLTAFIGAVAAIALVVGSIGIANIMIVSVTERTREIGIMKAVGARRRDIMQLFLLESVILGVIGPVVGVIAGLGFGYLGVRLLDWPMAYPIDWAIIAIVVGISVGVISGLYPAWRGARVDPIEALRHE